MKKTKEESRQRIHFRIRKKVQGSTERPRLTVFRSNKGIYAQLVDDTTGNVVTAASTLLLDNASGNKVEQAKAVGKLIADCIMDSEIKYLLFDRSGYLYHGRVKALADSARESGLKF